jgi:hypothetical protein
MFAPLAAADEVDDAVRAVEKLGGTIRRAKDRPGQPIVAVELPGCAVSSDFLRIVQHFPSLEWLDL